eukprot:gene4921-6269_t
MCSDENVGTTILVGAPGRDYNEIDGKNILADVGAVFVFSYTGNEWRQSNELHPVQQFAMMGFGHSLSAHNDIIAVGAPFPTIKTTSTSTSSSSSESGVSSLYNSVHVYKLHAGSVEGEKAFEVNLLTVLLPTTHTQSLNTGPITNDLYGYKVSVFSDTLYNGVRMANIAVSAPNDYTNGDKSGAVYIYNEQGQSLTAFSPRSLSHPPSSITSVQNRRRERDRRLASKVKPQSKDGKSGVPRHPLLRVNGTANTTSSGAANAGEKGSGSFINITDVVGVDTGAGQGGNKSVSSMNFGTLTNQSEGLLDRAATSGSGGARSKTDKVEVTVKAAKKLGNETDVAERSNEVQAASKQEDVKKVEVAKKSRNRVVDGNEAVGEAGVVVRDKDGFPSAGGLGGSA